MKYRLSDFAVHFPQNLKTTIYFLYVLMNVEGEQTLVARTLTVPITMAVTHVHVTAVIPKILM